jgi:hypothetical protein
MRRLPRLRRGVPLLALGLVLAAALTMPIPRLGDPGLNRIVGLAQERLPGWSIVRATDTWEGGYALVARCGTRQLGFQVIPGHGLPPEDAWLQPNDSYAQARLAEVSDYPSFLLWRARPVLNRTLSCHDELAREVDDGFSTTRNPASRDAGAIVPQRGAASNRGAN